MFVIGYDFEDMPPNSQTFLRQRTVYMPIDRSSGASHGTTNASSTITYTSQPQPDKPSNRDTTHLVPPVSSIPTGGDRRSAPELFWHDQGQRGSADPQNKMGTTNGTNVSEPDHSQTLADDISTDGTGDLSSSCSCSSLRSTTSSMCSLASSSNEHSHPPPPPHSHHSSGAVKPTDGLVSRPSDSQHQPAFLRYLVHLRFHTTRSGRLYLHTDLRLIFARDKFEFDPRVATYELRSFVDAPSNPRYSPKK
ncbi:unnamed protein product [Echinostoma caproni]|uniref:Chromosome_seg domain-containing protein n=1 Tax=Echinostoma caproni TaxID=27848 RepID=A0A183B1D8_9TREM|nr:unnamed protein product [Echinostoma caproni]